ncbi:MAG TPA: glycerophosphodiester phosphodiesterase family protein [Ignavibacteriaceae bacterium]|nr:glycerophosphodiester phosphodiesterase family protein [Ignavibacteriaceae bacterium]
MLKTLKLIKTWILEFFRPCPAGKSFAGRNGNFLICGHRGAPVKEVENTIKSFERALNEGANSLETDLCLTKDNEVVLWHDWNPNGINALLRESGFEPWVKYKPLPPPVFSEFRKSVHEITLKEFRENFHYKKRKRNPRIADVHIPTLREFFEWSKGQKKLKHIFFDIKTPGEIANLSINILNCITEFAEEFKPEYQIIIETTELEVHKLLKAKFPQYSYCLDIDSNPGFILNPEDYSAVKAAVRFNNDFAMAFRPQKVTIANWTTYRRIVQFDLDLKEEHNAAYPDKKITLIGCTVDKRKELRCLFRLGIDGIQTNFPSRLKRIAERRRMPIAYRLLKAAD